MTPDELFQLADRLAGKPRQWLESGPAADGVFSFVMFLGFERALRQYGAIVELLRRGFCDDALVLARSLYELNVNLSAIKSEIDAGKFARFAKLQQLLLEKERLNDQLQDAEKDKESSSYIAKCGQRLKAVESALKEFAEFKTKKEKWQKSWSGLNVKGLAERTAQDTGANTGQHDYWVYGLGSLFTHNAPGALFLGVGDSQLSQEKWKELRARRDHANRNGLPAILHEASMCFVDIVGMAGPCIQRYQRPWFDDAMQTVLPALCDGDTTETG